MNKNPSVGPEWAVGHNRLANRWVHTAQQSHNWLNIGRLQVPAGLPAAKHKIVYSMQTIRQLIINADE